MSWRNNYSFLLFIILKLCKLLNISISHCWNFSQGNTAINRIFYNGMGEYDHNILNLLNDTAHVELLQGHV